MDPSRNQENVTFGAPRARHNNRPVSPSLPASFPRIGDLSMTGLSVLFFNGWIYIYMERGRKDRMLDEGEVRGMKKLFVRESEKGKKGKEM